MISGVNWVGAVQQMLRCLEQGEVGVGRVAR
jgi:hypothetical protein